METISVFEVLPEEDSKTIANLIWKLLDKAGIETTKDAELQKILNIANIMRRLKDVMDLNIR